ncbi:MAG: thioredoxin family protein [Planctomycetota bacterium]
MKRFALVPVLLLLFVPAAFAELKPGDDAPDFKLFGVDYTYHSLARYPEAKAIAVVFTCNHCPVAKGYEDTLIAIAKEFQPKGIVFLAVNPNPADIISADGFPQMIERAKEKGFPFPYLYDQTQEVARAYGASTTPHVFVVSPTHKILYEGAVDNRHKEPNYLADALNAILAGKEIPENSTSQWGCSVKYREKSE